MRPSQALVLNSSFEKVGQCPPVAWETLIKQSSQLMQYLLPLLLPPTSGDCGSGASEPHSAADKGSSGHWTQSMGSYCSVYQPSPSLASPEDTRILQILIPRKLTCRALLEGVEYSLRHSFGKLNTGLAHRGDQS